jgi:hypothetical protein
MGLHLLPSVACVVSLNEEVSFWSWCHHLWGNRRRGLCGRNVLHPWCGHGESERAPRAVPSGGREAGASFPTRCCEELLGGVLDPGLSWGRCPVAS